MTRSRARLGISLFVLAGLISLLVVSLSMRFYQGRRHSVSIETVTNARSLNTTTQSRHVDTGSSAAGTKAAIPELDAHPIVVPEEFWARPWRDRLNEYEKMIQVEIKPIPAPEQYNLQLRPEPGKKYQYANLVSTWAGPSDKDPLMQMVNDWIVAVKLDGKGQLLMEFEQKPTWGLAHDASMGTIVPKPLFKQQMQVRDGRLYETRTEPGSEQKQISVSSGDIQNIVFDLPQDHTPQLGESWQTNSNTSSPSEVTYTLEGFADVAGVKTAKFTWAGKITLSAKVVGTITATAQRETVAVLQAERGRRSGNLAPPMKVESPQIQTKGTVYVDLETGLVVHTEDEIITSIGGAESRTVSISQRMTSHE